MVAAVLSVAFLAGVSTPARGLQLLEIAMPSEAAVGDVIMVVITGPPNTSFELSVSGPGNYRLQEQGNLQATGVYRVFLRMADEGEYLVTVSATIDAQTRSVRAVCTGECQRLRLLNFLSISDERNYRWFVALISVVVLIEALRMVEAGRGRAEMSRWMGLPDPAQKLKRKLGSIRFFLAGTLGARQWATNPRLAAESEKNVILDAINRKTEQGNRPVGFDPEYDYELTRIFSTWSMSAKNMRDYHTNERLMLMKKVVPVMVEPDIIDWEPTKPSPELQIATVQHRRRLMFRAVVGLGVAFAFLPPLLGMLANLGFVWGPAVPFAAATYALVGPTYFADVVYLPMVVALLLVWVFRRRLS